MKGVMLYDSLGIHISPESTYKLLVVNKKKKNIISFQNILHNYFKVIYWKSRMSWEILSELDAFN